MRLVVAGQHQARRPAARDERAVDAVDEAGAVQVLINAFSTDSVASGWSPRVLAHASNLAARPGFISPTRPMGCASTADATRWGCAFSRLMMNDPPMH